MAYIDEKKRRKRSKGTRQRKRKRARMGMESGSRQSMPCRSHEIIWEGGEKREGRGEGLRRDMVNRRRAIESLHQDNKSGFKKKSKKLFFE